MDTQRKRGRVRPGYIEGSLEDCHSDKYDPGGKCGLVIYLPVYHIERADAHERIK